MECSASIVETHLPKNGVMVGLNAPLSNVLVSKLAIGERTDIDVTREVSVEVNYAEFLVSDWCASLHVCGEPKCTTNVGLVLYPIIEGNANTTWVSSCDICSSHFGAIGCINWE